MLTKDSERQYAVAEAIKALDTCARKHKDESGRHAEWAARLLEQAFKPEYIK